MLTLAGERGWIPMSINFVVPATLRMHWQTYSESAARAGPRPMQRAVSRNGNSATPQRFRWSLAAGERSGIEPLNLTGSWFSQL